MDTYRRLNPDLHRIYKETASKLNNRSDKFTNYMNFQAQIRKKSEQSSRKRKGVKQTIYKIISFFANFQRFHRSLLIILTIIVLPVFSKRVLRFNRKAIGLYSHCVESLELACIDLAM